MILRTIILGLAVCFVFSSSTFAQDQIKDRFSYSYGVLLGDNLKQVGLSADVVSTDELLRGAIDFVSGSSEMSEQTTQQTVNAKLKEITDNNKAKAEGKASKEWTKGELSQFSYQYGLLIGANWKNFGVTPKELDQAEFKKGMFTILSGKEAAVTVQAAQSEVRAKYQLILEQKAEKTIAANKAFLEKNKQKDNVVSLASGVQYEILKKGEGQQATASSNVTTHYHGTLIDGSVFDSSVERGEPISFGISGVIKGWQEVIPMMKVGSKWRVYIPSDLGYGNRARGAKIPANSLLIFEIELISVQ